MRAALRIGALALAVGIGTGIGARWNPLHRPVEAQASAQGSAPQEPEAQLSQLGPSQARFQLVRIRYKAHGSDGTALLDSQAGRVWELTTVKDGSTILQELPLAPAPAPTE